MRATGTSIIGSAYAQRTTRLKRRRKNRLSALETLEHRHLLTSMPIITEFSDSLIDNGHLLPKHKAVVTEFLKSLQRVNGTVTFTASRRDAGRPLSNTNRESVDWWRLRCRSR